MIRETARPNYRKLLIQLVVGAVFGAVMGLGISALLLPQLEIENGVGAFALAGVGLMYTVMGLFVALGLMFPSVGAKVLNVADREDLADQRALLTGSAVCCIALGLALLMLALSGPQGQISGALAAGALAFAFVLSAVITVFQWKLYDELMRGISMEASAFMAAILVPAIALWAVLTHLGQAGPIDPLGLIALLAGSMLLGSFMAAGRRGLLLPA
jgi:hypothetical protein